MLVNIVAFLITVSFLVFFHELGHYFVARIFGVKILTFSIGFGPKLIKFNGKHNEWCISLIPIGGYVKMLDEREAKVSKSEQHLAFNNKKPYQKILIAAAGPLFNIFFAILAYFIVALSGVDGLKPVILSSNPSLNQINNIQIESNSQIMAINSIPVKSWTEADELFTKLAYKNNTLELSLHHQNHNIIKILDLKNLRQHYNNNLSLETLGLYPYILDPIIAYIEPGSPAQRAHLQAKDKITAINGKQMSNWFEIASLIQSSPGSMIDISILRQQQKLQFKLIPEANENNGQFSGKIGIMPTLNQIKLQEIGIKQNLSWFNSLKYAVKNTYNVIWLNINGIYSIINGQISWHNLGGPITVAKAGGGAINSGFNNFIEFLALISISLGIMNLLPIPVLDGGHILIYTIEWVLGHQLSKEFQILIFKVGFLLIIGLTLVALYNDFLGI